MGFADLAIDLAAVLNASRGVASKHVALRSRQLDRYGKTSTVAANAAQRASRAEEWTEEHVRTAGETQHLDHIDGARASAQPRREAPSTPSAPSKAQKATTATASTSSLGIAGSRQIIASQFQPADEKKTAPRKAPSDRLEVPPDTDVHVFRTARGSKILESVRTQGRPKFTPQAPETRPARDHPMRHWPPPPHQEQPEGISSPLANDVAADNTPLVVQNTASQHPQKTIGSVLGSDARKADEDWPKAAEQLAQDETPVTPAYVLKESKVPSSRFSRLWNYGGLAAGMLGGAMSEGFSRALGSGAQGSVMLSGGNMERLVARLSRMRGAALKLGQMMSFQDSKMLPAPIQEVLQRVQDRADYMPAWQRDRVLVSNLGADWRDMFSDFEEKPTAAASIGQVHKATLKSNGQRVAVKIQFPGVADSINSDLDNLGILLTATRLLPKGLYLDKTIDNARLELGWECDYEREADCARRYKELLQSEEDVFVVPNVYPEASGKQVLTMEFMDGTGVTRVKSFTQEQRDWIGSQILRLCIKEITEFNFMQTDPNWTNFLYNDRIKKLELLDFGASREYPQEFVTQYVRLLEAASRSDRGSVKALSESLGYLTGHESKAMLEAHTRSVLTLAEPFLESAPEVYDFKDQTITERVKALIPVMLRERLAPPPEETYSLHRKLSGAFLLCARLGSRVRCREMFADSLRKTGYISDDRNSD